jgi:GNAT superfamily N-acetyltransferase
LRSGDVARYPARFAPFLGVASAAMDVGAAFAELIAPGESVYLLGVLPRIPRGYFLQATGPVVQMVCTTPVLLEEGPEIVGLTAAHRADVLALTARVYPHYFREGTLQLGRYFGIYTPDASGAVRLAAMIGERLGTETHTELSAICTHPDLEGCGYARRLTAFLGNDALAHGYTPFLHVSRENGRALRLYERMGYSLRRNIGFWEVRAESRQGRAGAADRRSGCEFDLSVAPRHGAQALCFRRGHGSSVAQGVE